MHDEDYVQGGLAFQSVVISACLLIAGVVLIIEAVL